MADIEKAIQLAVQAHIGQKDKAEKPYILHPLRVMNQFSIESEMIVAVLHDVVEDTDITLDDLKKQGFSDLVVDAIGCLSKQDDESYEDFIKRIYVNDLAKKVKIVDIKDNLDLRRLSELSEKDLKRIKKYHEALIFLSK